MHRLPAGKERSKLRAKTPAGFADAVFKANHKTCELFGKTEELECQKTTVVVA